MTDDDLYIPYSHTGTSYDDAACARPENAAFDWFPEGDGAAAMLKLVVGICEQCPIRVACLADAKARGEEYGVWGGIRVERGVWDAPVRSGGRPRRLAA